MHVSKERLINIQSPLDSLYEEELVHIAGIDNTKKRIEKYWKPMRDFFDSSGKCSNIGVACYCMGHLVTYDRQTNRKSKSQD